MGLRRVNAGVTPATNGLFSRKRISAVRAVIIVKFVGADSLPRPAHKIIPPGGQRISDLYELDSGSFNPLFGSLEMEKPQGEPRLFVIAGGGAGIPVYRALQKRRVPFFTGILQENDVDYQLAKELAAETVAARAFEPIGEREYGAALEKLRACDAVINCLSSYGGLNRINARLFDEAKKMGLRAASQDDISAL